MPGLTDSEAAKLAKALQDESKATNEIRGRRRELRQRKKEPPLPPGWSKNIHIKHKTYEIDDAVRVLRNRLIAAPISILVFAKSGKAGAQQDASRIRRFLDKTWLDFNSGYPSAHFVGTDSQVADGVWPAHLAWNQDWIDAAVKTDDVDEYLRGAGLPFVLETHDPLNVHVEFCRKKKPLRVVSIEQVEIGALLNKRYKDDTGAEYSLAYDKEARKLTRSAEPTSYDDLWSSGYNERVTIAKIEDAEFVHHVLFEGGGVSEDSILGLGKWPNLFKRPAWVFMAGDFSNSTDLLERWKPLVLGMYSMGDEVNMIRSARLNSGVLAGLFRLKMRRTKDSGYGPVKGGAQKAELVFNEDGTVTEPEGWESAPFEFPTGADSLLENAQASVEMELARYKPAPALRGIREEGVSSGYQQALIAEAAMTDLDPPLAMQSQGIKDILYLVLDGAKAINDITDGKIDTLYVRTLNESREGNTEEVLPLKADEIKDFEITVRQSSMSPTSRIGMWEEGRRARKSGEIDDVEMFEHFFGYEDGVEMQRRATEQKMYDSLVMEAIATAQAMVKAEIAKRKPVAATILGPSGEPISGPGAPPAGGPEVAAGPGQNMTLAQPVPPGPQPVPTAPTGGESGGGTLA